MWPNTNKAHPFLFLCVCVRKKSKAIFYKWKRILSHDEIKKPIELSVLRDVNGVDVDVDTIFLFAGRSGGQTGKKRKGREEQNPTHEANAPDSHSLSVYFLLSLLVVESKHLAATEHPSRFQDGRSKVVCLWVPQAVASYANRLALLFREGHLDHKLIPFVTQILHSLKHEGANFFAWL